MQFALHLCGNASRSLARNGSLAMARCFLDAVGPQRLRIQRNSYEPSMVSEPPIAEGVKWIYPCKTAEGARMLLETTPHDVLLDASGGRGMSPGRWPDPHEILLGGAAECRLGLAGGISHSTLDGALLALLSLPRGAWIDLETGARNEQDVFEIARASHILRTSGDLFEAVGAMKGLEGPRYGKALRVLRETSGMMMRDLARQVGMKVPRLSSIETGGEWPTQKEMAALSQAFKPGVRQWLERHEGAPLLGSIWERMTPEHRAEIARIVATYEE